MNARATALAAIAVALVALSGCAAGIERREDRRDDRQDRREDRRDFSSQAQPAGYGLGVKASQGLV